jgi:hypothetical protein
MRFLSTTEESSSNSSSDDDGRIKVAIITVCSGVAFILLIILIAIIYSRRIKNTGGGLSTFNEIVINKELNKVKNLVQEDQVNKNRMMIDSDLIEIKRDMNKSVGLNEKVQCVTKHVSICNNLNDNLGRDDIDNNPSSKNVIVIENEYVSKLNSKKFNQNKVNSKKRLYNLDSNTREDISIKPSSKNINQELNKILSKGLQKVDILNNKYASSNIDLFGYPIK